ncbi:MAG: cytochrome c3 family protein [Deferribacterota bacterium]|nr:cytochrome c3 family protein [Deferribacterota bacterium]
MKKLFIFLFVVFIANVYAQVVMGPTEVNLKEKYTPNSETPAVIFPHEVHVTALNSQCYICHTRTESGEIKDFRTGEALDYRYASEFHAAFCGYCHDVVSTENQNTCIDCHESDVALPENIDLRERYAPNSSMPPVIFPHSLHVSLEIMNCKICHKETGSIKDYRTGYAFNVEYAGEFHTAFCGYCHVTQSTNEKNNCVKCHVSN